MKNKDYNSQIMTDSALLMQMMGLEMRKVYFTSDDDTQNFEVHWKKEVIKGVFFEVMAEVIVNLEISEPWGYIEDEGYQRPDPGDYVLNKRDKEWGIGQVQSNIDNRVTINFPEVGKVVIDGSRIILKMIYEQR